MKTNRIGVAIFVLVATVTCSPGSPTGTPPASPPPPPPPPTPAPGAVTVSLTTPHSDDGAILLELKGANIHAVASAHAAWKVFVDSSASPIRAVIAGDLAGGALLTFTVPDTTALGSYSATIVDISDRNNKLRSDLPAYVLKLGH